MLGLLLLGNAVLILCKKAKNLLRFSISSPAKSLKRLFILSFPHIFSVKPFSKFYTGEETRKWRTEEPFKVLHMWWDEEPFKVLHKKMKKNHGFTAEYSLDNFQPGSSCKGARSNPRLSEELLTYLLFWKH